MLTRILSKYSSDGELDFYRDVIPRLKTVLQNRRAQNFLSESEIGGSDVYSGEKFPDTVPFPMSNVRYYGRYRFPKKLVQKESEFIGTFLEGVRE